MADSKNAYIFNILPYTGSGTLQEASTQYEDLPQPVRIVLHVTELYLNKGHHVFTDRYYTSIPLAQALADRSTSFTGTSMRNHAELPDPIRLTPSRLADDEVKAFTADRLSALEWRAAKKKKSLIMISNESSSNMVQIQSRGSQQEVQKPFVVNHYNHSMNGVDRADQYTVYYSFIQKARKWWRKLFFWLLEVATVNSYILYKLNTTTAITHLEYRRKVLEALALRHIQSAPPRALAGRPRKRQRSISTDDPEQLNGQSHFPGKLSKPKECVVCSDPAKGQRHRSLYYCTLVHLTPHYALSTVSNCTTQRNPTEFIISSCLLITFMHLPALAVLYLSCVHNTPAIYRSFQVAFSVNSPALNWTLNTQLLLKKLSNVCPTRYFLLLNYSPLNSTSNSFILVSTSLSCCESQTL